MPENNFTSQLPEGRERFIAQVLVHALRNGLRTPEDFVRHFPPAAIMAALAGQPDLRAKILVPTVGTKEAIALKKSALSAGDDLQIALSEKMTDAAEIVAFFDPDDRVMYLDVKLLWIYATESEFWCLEGDGRDSANAKAHIAFMLQCGLDNDLLTHRDIVEGVTVAEIVKHFTPEEIVNIISGTLYSAHEDKPFHEKDLLAATPPAVFVERIPLPDIWERVIVPRVAKTHGYVEPPPPAEPEESEESDDEPPVETEGEDSPKANAASDAALADDQGAAPADGHDEGWSNDDDNGTHETGAPKARSDSDVPDRRSDVPETAEIDVDAEELAAIEAAGDHEATATPTADEPKPAKSLEALHPGAPTLDMGDVTHRPASLSKGHNRGGSSLMELKAKIDLDPKFQGLGIKINNMDTFMVEELQTLLALFETKVWPKDEEALREATLTFCQDAYQDRFTTAQLREMPPQTLRHKFLNAVREQNRELALKLAPRNPPPSPKKDKGPPPFPKG